jgi:hypothetical protein
MHRNRDRATVTTGGAAMDQDASMVLDLTGWSGSRRTLLGAAAALGLPILLPGCDVTIGTVEGEKPADRVPQLATPLRDFAYVCAALMLEAHERDDWKALADLRYQPGPKSALYLTPEALVAAQVSTEADARRIFADGAKQLYLYVAANTDDSRGLVLSLVEATTPEGADNILQTFRRLWPQDAVQLATADEAPDADSGYLGTMHFAQPGADSSRGRYWRFGGVRFGSLVAAWQVGFQTASPDPAMAAPINRLLRDYLTDLGTTARRGASLAFLLTVPEQPTISIVQTGLEGTVLGYWDWDEARIAKRQAEATSAGIVNVLGGSFRGPGRLALNLIISEHASAEQARANFASLQHDQPTTDQQFGVTRRALASDEFRLTGWDDWQASAVRVQRDDYGSLGVVVAALLDTFRVYVEAVDEVLPETVSAPPGKDDPALRQWSAMAQQLLAPMPAAARNASDSAARAIFPPPLPAFTDPLAG